METEIPAMLNARERLYAERFSYHSSRMRMKHVRKEELEAMDRESLRCAAELSDARVDVIGYACLVAIMSMGLGYHRASAANLARIAREEGVSIPIVTSAGALVEVLGSMGLRRVAVVMPYMKPLAALVVRYLGHEGIEVVDHVALEISDNLAVGARDPMCLVDDVMRLDMTRAQAVVLSACVQMPSLPAIPRVQDRIGMPVVSAATCTVRKMLESLSLPPIVPDAGAALSKLNSN
jgi:maleate isomerase